MKICTSKQDIKRSELKEILKDEGFKRNKYDSKKYVLLVHNDDNINTDKIGYISIMNFFGQQLGLMLRPAKLELADKYIIVRFQTNIVVFDSEDRFIETINTCMNEVTNCDGKTLFKSQLVAERTDHCSFRLGELLGTYMKLKGECN